jgi:hypothetical protein
MDEYTQPEYVDRRLRYFDGQFLREQDFIAEQQYHLDRERRLARVAHTAGVVEGLEVTAVPNAPKVTVAAGTALDGHGRLLVRVDAGDPLDLTALVDRDGPVPVLVTLAYDAVEADAPQGGASPRWREAPDVAAFREGDPRLPAEDDALRMARVVLQPDGTAAVDAAWAAARSGLRVRGGLEVTGPASFPGGIDGGSGADGGAAALHVSGDLGLTGPAVFDSSVRLDVTNGSADFGRANIVLTGRFQDGNDGWTFGSAGRTSLVFARNAAAHGQALGARGDEEASLQLEGNSRALGFLTRDRGADPALVLTQDGRLGVGTDQPGAPLDVAGDVAVRGGVGLGQLGRWTATVSDAGGTIQIRIAAGSLHNVAVVRPQSGLIHAFQVLLPTQDIDNWYGQYRCFQSGITGVVSDTAVMYSGSIGGEFILGGSSANVTLPAGAVPQGLIVEVYHVTTVAAG